MKKIAIIALTLCAISCAKQLSDNQILSLENTIIVASTENDVKVSITTTDNTTFNHFWDISDNITVFDGSSNKQFSLVDGQGTGSASFSGEQLTASAPYYAVYPYDTNNGISGSTITVNYPSTQTYRSGNYASGANIMIGKSIDGQKFNFKNACAYVQLNFAAQPGTVIKSIEISATDGEVIAGEANVIVDANGNISSVVMSGSSKTITVNCLEGLDITTAQSIYVPVPPVSLAHGFQVVVRAADYTSMGLKSNSVLSKNKVTKMPSIIYNGTWTAYGAANCILAYGLSSVSIDVTAHPVSYQEVQPTSSQGGYRKNNITQTKVETIPVTAEVVWKENGLTTFVLNPTISNNVVQISSIEGFGNAMIAIKDANGNILWNYVIWKPEMDPIGTGESNLLPLLGAKKMMKPFLGAMRYYTTPDYNTASGDEGLYYQYGRVEPISLSFGQTASDINNPPYSIQYSSLVSGVSQNIDDAAILAARQSPNHYIANWGMSYLQIWHRSGKSYLDPCPEGYSIINENDYKSAVVNSASAIYSYQILNSGSVYGMLYKNTLGEDVLFDKVLRYFYYAKGIYSIQRNGSFWWTGSYGLSTAPCSNKLYFEAFYPSSNYDPGCSIYVRCQKL